jgi:hypothetical protein
MPRHNKLVANATRLILKNMIFPRSISTRKGAFQFAGKGSHTPELFHVTSLAKHEHIFVKLGVKHRKRHSPASTGAMHEVAEGED